MKTCRSCLARKAYSEFQNDKKMKGGKVNKCNGCRSYSQRVRRRNLPVSKNCARQGCIKPAESHSENSLCQMHRHRLRLGGDIGPAHEFYPSGSQHPGWKGADISYSAAHKRLAGARGSASAYACVDCGDTGREWSYNKASSDERADEQGQNAFLPFSADPFDYDPRCVKCHRNLDCRPKTLH